MLMNNRHALKVMLEPARPIFAPELRVQWFADFEAAVHQVVQDSFPNVAKRGVPEVMT
jgi:hypothetical protein